MMAPSQIPGLSRHWTVQEIIPGFTKWNCRHGVPPSCEIRADMRFQPRKLLLPTTATYSPRAEEYRTLTNALVMDTYSRFRFIPNALPALSIKVNQSHPFPQEQFLTQVFLWFRNSIGRTYPYDHVACQLSRLWVSFRYSRSLRLPLACQSCDPPCVCNLGQRWVHRLLQRVLLKDSQEWKQEETRQTSMSSVRLLHRHFREQ